MQSEWYFYAVGVVLLCSRSGTFLHRHCNHYIPAIHTKKEMQYQITSTIVSLGLVIILPSITLVSTCHSFLILIKPCFSEKSPSFMHSHSKLTMDYNADRRTMVDVLKHLKSRYVAL